MTAEPGSAVADDPSNVDARYGRSPARRRRDRRLLVGLAGVFALVLVAWVVWVSLDRPSNDLDVRDHGFGVVDETAVEVRYQLSVAPGTAARCAVEAMNEQFAIIGLDVVDVPPSEQRVRDLASIVRTTSEANTGLISRCWVP